jgi:uncharacterized phage protein (TIGR01671 family)
MKRKIEFRAFDTELKVMMDDGGICVYSDGTIGMDIGDFDSYYGHIVDHDSLPVHIGAGDDWLFILDKIELMQFTDLFDKNNTPIYEGDIVRDSEVIYWVEFGSFTHDECTFQGWLIKSNRLGFGGGLSPDDSSVLEVIGNIYQHAHLLEQK